MPDGCEWVSQTGMPGLCKGGPVNASRMTWYKASGSMAKLWISKKQQQQADPLSGKLVEAAGFGAKESIQARWRKHR